MNPTTPNYSNAAVGTQQRSNDLLNASKQLLNSTPGVQSAVPNNLPVSTTLTADTISKNNTFTVPPPINDTTHGDNLSITTNNAVNNATNDIKINKDKPGVTSITPIQEAINKYKELSGVQATQGDFTSKLQEEQNLASKNQTLNSINNEILTKTTSYDNQIKKLKENAGGAFGGGLDIQVNNLERQKNEELANLSIRKAVALGDVNTANTIIDQKVKAKFEPIDNQLKSQLQIFNMLSNDMTEKEKFQAQALLTDKQHTRALQEDAYKGVQDALAKGGAPQSVFKQAEDAFNKGDISGMWAVASPYAKKAVTTTNNMTTDNERALLTQFNTSPIVKDYNVIVAQKLSTDNVIKNGVGGPADLALVYTFMKGLDPNSVVRESEFDAAAKSGNIFSGAFAKYNGYLKEKGGFLPDNVRTEFQNLVNQKLSAQQQQYDNFAKNYRDIASRQGLNPDNVVVNYGGALTTETPKETTVKSGDTKVYNGITYKAINGVWTPQ